MTIGTERRDLTLSARRFFFEISVLFFPSPWEGEGSRVWVEPGG
jgi:hypothetical protein